MNSFKELCSIRAGWLRAKLLLAIIVLAILPSVGYPSEKFDSVEVRRLIASGKIQEAKNLVVPCADAGDGACQFILAEMVQAGQGFHEDADTAKALYQMSYENGYEPAAAFISGAHLKNNNDELPTIVDREVYSIDNVSNGNKCENQETYYDEGNLIARVDCGFVVEAVIISKTRTKYVQIAMRFLNHTKNRIDINPDSIRVNIDRVGASVLDAESAARVLNKGTFLKRLAAGMASTIEAYGAGSSVPEHRTGSFTASSSDGVTYRGKYRERSADTSATQDAINSAANRARDMQDNISSNSEEIRSGVSNDYLYRNTIFPGREYTGGLIVEAGTKVKEGDSVDLNFEIEGIRLLISLKVP